MDTALLQHFNHPLFERYRVQVDIMRLDQIDPLISGNKWFKLQPLLERSEPQRPVLSFGGAYSNHLHALARFGQKHGIPTMGLVRGESKLTPTLKDAQDWGMRLHFVQRDQYRQFRELNDGVEQPILAQLAERFGRFDLLPEGGATDEAIGSCGKIWSLLPQDYRVDRVLVSVGTGTTLAGMVLQAPANTQLEGVAAIAQFAYLQPQIDAHLAGRRLNRQVSWRLVEGAPLGFAKLNAELSGLLLRAQALQLALDPVYTLRLVHSFIRRLLVGEFEPGERILLIHTGGLQGLRGQQQRLSRLASAHCGPIPL